MAVVVIRLYAVDDVAVVVDADIDDNCDNDDNHDNSWYLSSK